MKKKSIYLNLETIFLQDHVKINISIYFALSVNIDNTYIDQD